jgi:hypothetical protein
MDDFIGKRFGTITIMAYSHNDKKHRWYYGKCECGSYKTYRKALVKRQKSCGCLRYKAVSDARKTQVKHGHGRRGKKSKSYNTWAGMVDRCNNPNHPAYKYYGGRGIKICHRWLKFENFLEDMGDKPIGHSIDRINPDGNYSKENCRWATDLQQKNNTRRNVMITHEGRTQSLADWAREFGIPYKQFYALYRKQGKSMEYIGKFAIQLCREVEENEHTEPRT